MLKQLKNWIIHWMWFTLVLWLVWVSYAAYTTITSVGNWDTLTSTTFNNLINNVEYNNSQLLWVNQTRQDVKASRSDDTLYTNDTWRPIEVTVVSQAPSVWANVYWVLTVDWITKEYLHYGNSTWVQPWATVSAIIPNGSTYKFNSFWGIIAHWKELR